MAVVELSGGGRPPLHHHDFDETLYVLPGELTFQFGDDMSTRRAGEIAFAPDVAHTYANLSGTPGPCSAGDHSGGLERYFDRFAAEVTGTEPPPEALKPDPGRVTVGPALRGEPS